MMAGAIAPTGCELRNHATVAYAIQSVMPKLRKRTILGQDDGESPSSP